MPFEVNVLINNAGVSQFKLFEQASESDISDISDIITTNTIAPMQLTQALLPLLKQYDKAQIINMGSTYGSIGFPGYTAYCASKFALRGFSQTLSRELADSNIRVKYLAPLKQV
ncbi:MAG: short-subunit dehydrogenase [Colwellia sp.]